MYNCTTGVYFGTWKPSLGRDIVDWLEAQSLPQSPRSLLPLQQLLLLALHCQYLAVLRGKDWQEDVATIDDHHFSWEFLPEPLVVSPQSPHALGAPVWSPPVRGVVEEFWKQRMETLVMMSTALAYQPPSNRAWSEFGIEPLWTWHCEIPESDSYPLINT